MGLQLLPAVMCRAIPSSSQLLPVSVLELRNTPLAFSYLLRPTPRPAVVPTFSACSVSSVFIWSMASWDVLGVYPESTTSEGSYRDPDVLAALAAYNTAVRQVKNAQQPEQEEQQRTVAAGEATLVEDGQPAADSLPTTAGRMGIVAAGLGVAPASG